MLDVAADAAGSLHHAPWLGELGPGVCGCPGLFERQPQSLSGAELAARLLG